MKRSTTLLFALLLVSTNVFAQQLSFNSANIIQIDSPEAICTLHTDDLNGMSKVHRTATAKTGQPATATFSVEYFNSDEMDPWPEEAKTAFEEGLAIWGTHIASSVDIKVEATWYDYGGCGSGGIILGSAGPRVLINGFTNIPESSLFYPISMANAIAGSDQVPSLPDVTARFNKDCGAAGSDRWYYGVDGNTPSNKLDFLSVVLHELGHGLGFVGSASLDDGNNSNGQECDGVDGHGCLDDFVYDAFAVDAQAEGKRLTDDAFYVNDTILLGSRLAGDSAAVYFDGTAANYANAGTAAKLYTPTNWNSGSSYSHLDNATYDGTPNALMTSSISSGEVAHAPGAITCGMFGDMGWPLGDDCIGQLPVELTAFTGRADGNRALLAWETASETNNAGFEMYHAGPGGTYQNVAFIAGMGTISAPTNYAYEVANLVPGPHRFKLRQVDFDGTHDWSDEISVQIELEAAFQVSEAYPNPFNPSTSLNFAVNRTQMVRATVVDALGRTVKELLNEQVEAQREYTLTFDAASLPSGNYWILLGGTHFHASRPVLLVK